MIFATFSSRAGRWAKRAVVPCPPEAATATAHQSPRVLPPSRSRRTRNMQNRRDFLQTSFSLAAGLAGAVALGVARRTLAEEAPPETTSLRLGQYATTCIAPLYILDDLLREEGFADVRYVPSPAWGRHGETEF